MRWRPLIPLALLALTAWGCDVHEFPEGEDSFSLTINLKYDESLPDYKTYEFDTKTRLSEFSGGSAPYRKRTYVTVYEKLPGGTYSARPYWTQEVREDEILTLDRSFTLENVPASDFRVLAWTDFTRTDGGQDFFSLDGFPDVKMVDDLTGGTDFKAAFTAVDYFDLAGEAVQGSNVVKTINMKRPQAKLVFLATDSDEYLAKVNQRGVNPSEQKYTTVRDLNIQDYTLKVTYTGYIPDEWNIREDLASDSSTGHSFTSSASVNSDNTIDLGCDYIFADRETTLDLTFEIFDDRGMTVTRASLKGVPIDRGKVTTIKGRLMTHGISGAVVVDNKYDGEFNIYI